MLFTDVFETRPPKAPRADDDMTEKKLQKKNPKRFNGGENYLGLSEFTQLWFLVEVL